MKRGTLESLGLRKSRPLRAGHPDIGQPCLLCHNPFQPGDRTCEIPLDEDDEDEGTRPAHWDCVARPTARLRALESPTPEATRRFLEVLADASRKLPASAGRPYAGKVEFILKHGRAFEWRPLPRGVRRGAMRHCWENAYRLAVRKPDLFTYVEGYAINTSLALGPVEHAWCIDGKGLVVDPTWEEGADYFGVPFRAEYLTRVGLVAGCGLIENEEMGFPLLTGKHPVRGALPA